MGMVSLRRTPVGLRGGRFVVVAGPAGNDRVALRNLMARHLVRGVHDALWYQRNAHAHVGWRRVTGSVGSNEDDPRIQVEDHGIRVSTDELGIEPVYLSKAGPYAVASSELLPVVAAVKAMGRTPEPDMDAFFDLIVWGYTRGTRAIVRGVRRLAAAEAAFLGADGMINAPLASGIHATLESPAVQPERTATYAAFRDALREVVARVVARSIPRWERPAILWGPEASWKVLLGIGLDADIELSPISEIHDFPNIATLKREEVLPRAVRWDKPSQIDREEWTFLGSAASTVEHWGKLPERSRISRTCDHLIGPWHGTWCVEDVIPHQPALARDIFQLPSDDTLLAVFSGETQSALIEWVDRARADVQEADSNTSGQLSPALFRLLQERATRHEIAPALVMRTALSVSLPWLDPRILAMGGSLPNSARGPSGFLNQMLGSVWPHLVSRKQTVGALTRFLSRIGFARPQLQESVPHDRNDFEEMVPFIEQALPDLDFGDDVRIDGIRSAIRENLPGIKRILCALTMVHRFWARVDSIPDAAATLDD